jgi:hypothetical protein
MDNNILASDYGISQLESLIDSGYTIDLNQGMDARFVTPAVAKILSRISWIKYLRFSCDNFARVKDVVTAIEFLLKHGIKAHQIFVYFLVTKDINDCVRRIEFIKACEFVKSLNIYAQAERNESKGIIPNKIQLEFANRYVYSGKWRKENFFDYCEKRKIKFSFQESKPSENEKKMC